MSLNSIMGAAVTGLQAAQTQITTVSNNVANVNTPGYVQEVADQAPQVANGGGAGVTITDIRRVTNQYLETANLGAISASGGASVIADYLDQAQTAFGDPTSASSYLNQLSTVFSDFSAAANDPASTLPRTQALNDVTTFLDTTQQIAGTLNGLQGAADTRITGDVAEVNRLLGQISAINIDIVRTQANGGDTSGSLNAQGQLIQQLSGLMDVRTAAQPNGALVVTTGSGVALVGQAGPSTVSYTASGVGSGGLSIAPPGVIQSTPLTLGSGEIAGLLSLRNTQIPAVQDQLAAFVSGAAQAINAVHNANTAVPPPQTLTGRNTGLDLPTIIGDFSGKTTIAVVDSTGQPTTQVAIDFTAGTISVNGGGPTAFTPANFLTSLNTALAGTATASFANGALSLSAAAAGSGVAIADDPTTPATDGAQGFSQFFGLNDLLSSSEITNYNTGLKATDANGFNPGDTVSLQIADASGTPVSDVTVAIPAAPTMQDLVNSLNAPSGGVGQYGAFSLDANGALTFTPNTPGSATVSVIADNTQRGPGGPSLSQLFGVGVIQRGRRTTAFSIRSDIASNPMNMALAKLNLSAPVGQPVVALGDGTGALALAAVANSKVTFAAAGGLSAISTSVTRYASQLAGALGEKASAAADANTSAKAVQTEANTRLQSVEGVNIDQELVTLTTYQQAYSASARLLQAAKDMMDTLLGIVP
ncbi:MAG: flagellar hook-associated protein FlgK [Caulobacterales bacterium]